MHSRCGRFSIVFNGEIYNYRELRKELSAEGSTFVSDSDTEVLLYAWKAWGKACLPRLKGMFAFVVFDRDAQTLTCVRDAFGIKPLFYSASNTGFLFASELSAVLDLLPARPQINLRRASAYLAAGVYDDDEETFLDGVLQLRPGHLLSLRMDDGCIHGEQWWRPTVEQRTTLSFSNAAEQLRGMFLENIRLHLRSDVPVGAAVSGGLDSSAVVCAIRHIEPELPVSTFSYVARGSQFDEEHWVDRVNHATGASAHKVLVTADELGSDLDRLIIAQGEPFGGTSIYAQYRVFRLAQQHGVTVMLDGQGADELLAGYGGYPGPRMKSLADTGSFWRLCCFLMAWSKWPGRSFTQGLLALAGQSLPRSVLAMGLTALQRRSLSCGVRREFLQTCAQERMQSLMGSKEAPRGRSLVNALREAMTGRGLAALLRHADRNSMHWSIESRVPFLTTNMAEFLLTLPEEWLVSDTGETKHVFRAAMRGIVPEEILSRRDKIGFATPEAQWGRHLSRWGLSWIGDVQLPEIIDKERLRKELTAIAEGTRQATPGTWRALNFCRWTQLV